MPRTSSAVGELNGKYALLFKINMALIPIIFLKIMLWGTWVTVSLFDLQGFKNHGERWTKAQAMAEDAKIREYINEHFVHKDD